jgi:amino acid transporter
MPVSDPLPKRRVKEPGAARRARRSRGIRNVQPRVGKNSDPGSELGVVTGLAALSLDALTSVAYGPEAMIAILVLAGTRGLSWTVPLTIVIVGILMILVFSYTQVIAAHPEGGGSYAVAKENLGRFAALLAAASLIVDYVLTVAVSLSAGAASLGSAFPTLSHHLLLVSLLALALLTAVNMFGIGASARLLLVPAALFVLSVIAVEVVGPFHAKPIAVIGSSLGPIAASKTLGLLLLLKAFANGCTAITGIEAIANGVPAFKAPRVSRAQRTELSLGLLLLVMLLGLALLAHAHHVVPRGGVTILAQLTAGAFGKGAMFYIANLSVAVALGLAANTSFGGLPVLMSLLAKDNRLPHLFYLRAERPVYRWGIAALAAAAALLLVVVEARTERLIPMFTIGVFIGFTISQLGLVRHWFGTRPAQWRARAAINALGATLTGIAVVVALLTKFVAGAWVVALLIPLLILGFSRIEAYYGKIAAQLRIGSDPPRPQKRKSRVITAVIDVDLLTEAALSVALSIGETVVAVSVAGDEDERDGIRAIWDRWAPGVKLEVMVDPHRSLNKCVLHYLKTVEDPATTIVVLIPELVPRRRRDEVLHNQRGRLLAEVLRAKTDVTIATLPFHLHDQSEDQGGHGRDGSTR